MSEQTLPLVYVVDDDASVRSGLSILLQACGYPEARAAAEARACYASARDGHRDRAECEAL